MFLRDYAGHWCPKGFESIEGGWRCQPLAEQYSGPCDAVADFDGFNANMLDSWSQDCGAYWPCLGITASDIQQELGNILASLSSKAKNI